MTDEPNETQATPENEPFEVKWKRRSEPAPAAAAPDVPAAEDAAQLRARLAETEQRVKDLQDRWQRAAADLVNLRKRTEQEQAERERFASMVLVYELLPILDNFERALATIPGNLSMLTWIHGVMLIQRQLQAILEHQGLTPIQTEGQAFNPQLHEALAERQTSDVAAGTIVQEYQRGYTMHDRVIRPSLVEVASSPGAEADSESSADTESPVFVADPEAAEEEIAEQSETENVGP